MTQPNPLPDMTLLSPVDWPPAPGTLAITLQHPRGYVVYVHSIAGPMACVSYLDDPGTFTLPLDTLIPTGKTPADLCTMYDLPVLDWDAAVDLEMSMPDFTQTAPKKRTASKNAPKVTNKQTQAQLIENIKNMTPEQKQKITELLLNAFKK